MLAHLPHKNSFHLTLSSYLPSRPLVLSTTLHLSPLVSSSTNYKYSSPLVPSPLPSRLLIYPLQIPLPSRTLTLSSHLPSRHLIYPLQIPLLSSPLIYPSPLVLSPSLHISHIVLYSHLSSHLFIYPPISFSLCYLHLTKHTITSPKATLSSNNVQPVPVISIQTTTII